MNIVFVAFALGLAFNAAPGPVFAATLRYGVAGGFRPAFAVQVGSLAGDAVWALIGLTGIGLLASFESLRVPVRIGGAIYLLWLAYDSWRASDGLLTASASARSAASRPALRSGVMLSITNPQNIGYWSALGSAVGSLGVNEPTASTYVAFFIGFMLASLVWAVVCAAVVDRTIGSASPRWSKVTYRVCSVLFVALALASVSDTR